MIKHGCPYRSRCITEREREAVEWAESVRNRAMASYNPPTFHVVPRIAYKAGVDAAISAMCGENVGKAAKSASQKHLRGATLEEILEAIRKRAGELAPSQGDRLFDGGKRLGIDATMKAVEEFLYHRATVSD